MEKLRVLSLATLGAALAAGSTLGRSLGAERGSPFSDVPEYKAHNDNMYASYDVMWARMEAAKKKRERKAAKRLSDLAKVQARRKG